jgi:hypothetical protein
MTFFYPGMILLEAHSTGGGGSTLPATPVNTPMDGDINPPSTTRMLLSKQRTQARVIKYLNFDRNFLNRNLVDKK